MIIVSIILWFIGVLLFSFTLWRKLKDDYTKDTIYTFTLLILVISGFGWVLGIRLAPEFALWFVVLAGIVLGGIVLRRLELKFFELIDALVPAIFYFLIALHVGNLILDIEMNKYTSGVPAVIAFISMFIFKALATSYRRFSWYPSGKVGFAGLVTAGIYLIFRSVWSIVGESTIGQDVISKFNIGSVDFSISVGMINAIIGLISFLGLFYIVYLRSGRS